MRTISRRTARRLVLGRQGLWPGRRYAGKQGVAEAIRASECVQVDTISTIARSHDLTLWSRVADYDARWLNELCYGDRLFFDFGTILMIYPAQHLIYFQAIMQRLRKRLADVSPEAQAVRRHVLDEIARRGPLANRDFADRKRIPGGFNMVKDTSSALYHLYLGGHVMTHSRRNFERVYDLASNLKHDSGGDVNAVAVSFDGAQTADAAPSLSPDEAQTERFFALKAMRDLGLASGAQWARRVTIMQHERANARRAHACLNKLVGEGVLAAVGIEGLKETYYLPLEDYDLLDTLEQGGVPARWKPLPEVSSPATTNEEVNFLAPLDNVIWDRVRLKELFDFDYVWEVYKPAHARKWGYYTLPILFGDRFVGRIAPRLDRKTRTLHIEGFWLEEADTTAQAQAANPVFEQALNAGLTRFARFHDAAYLDTTALANQNNPHRVLLDNIASNYAAVQQ